MPANALNPLDLYDVRASLSEEERMVQDSVARFVDDAVLPIIRPHFENHTFPKELVAELAGLGLGAVGGYRDLQNYTQLGGSLTIFALPNR